MALPAVFVTGGNAGIGAAACKELVADRGCRVFMGSRSMEKGKQTVRNMELGDKEINITVVECDVQSDESVREAAAKVREALGEQKLFGLVNNAGLGQGQPDRAVIETNFYGPRRVCDNFLPMMDSKNGRVVNVGSGIGPGFVRNLSDVDVKRQLCSASTTFEELEALMNRLLEGDTFGSEPMEVAPPGRAEKALIPFSYGLSKAGLAAYSMQLARENPDIMVSCVDPGFISTNMSKGLGATKPPEEGTVSIMRCLFQDLPASGLFYGSDGLRSPLHTPRYPGQKEYDGAPPVLQ